MDMKDTEIVRAMRNLEQSGATMASEFHILNLSSRIARMPGHRALVLCSRLV